MVHFFPYLVRCHIYKTGILRHIQNENTSGRGFSHPCQIIKSLFETRRTAKRSFITPVEADRVAKCCRNFYLSFGLIFSHTRFYRWNFRRNNLFFFIQLTFATEKVLLMTKYYFISLKTPAEKLPKRKTACYTFGNPLMHGLFMGVLSPRLIDFFHMFSVCHCSRDVDKWENKWQMCRAEH